MNTRHNTSTVVKAVVLGALVAVTAGCAATGTRESTGQYVDSATLTAKVKTALASDSARSLLDVQVETFRDTVQLSGFVNSSADKARAAEIAGDVAGVVKVDNALVVKSAG